MIGQKYIVFVFETYQLVNAHDRVKMKSTFLIEFETGLGENI